MRTKRLARSLTAVTSCVIACALVARAGEKVIHHFPYPQNGETPSSPLVLGAAGNLFGTAVGGGTSNMGIVFELSPKYTVRTLPRFRRSTRAKSNVYNGQLRQYKPPPAPARAPHTACRLTH
jgi:uncharacterized repeat protein (TIGR03803 family)